MTQILLVGSDAPLLEGLAQSLAALGHAPSVVLTLHEAREIAAHDPPLIALVARDLAIDAMGGGETFGITLAPGGALVLYGFVGNPPGGAPLSPAIQRNVLADLMLPLERNRLVALVQHVEERAKAAGRMRRHGSTPERLEL
jgi:DNA-binding NtrC family response regulator